jgi:endoglucanase
VIYEVFNEPEKQSWEEVKSYAEEIVKTIRKNDADNIILVGCPEWDQRIDLVQKNPLKDKKYHVHRAFLCRNSWKMAARQNR